MEYSDSSHKLSRVEKYITKKCAQRHIMHCNSNATILWGIHIYLLVLFLCNVKMNSCAFPACTQHTQRAKTLFILLWVSETFCPWPGCCGVIVCVNYVINFACIALSKCVYNKSVPLRRGQVEKNPGLELHVLGGGGRRAACPLMLHWASAPWL